MFRSIRWKFITIYFILVFIAMAIIGVFIIQEFEDYNLKIVSERLNGVATNFLLPDIQKLSPDIPLDQSGEELQDSIDRWTKGFYREEIFIIDDDFQILATSESGLLGKNAVFELGDRIIIEGLKGNIVERDKLTANEETKNLVYPISRNGKVEGVLYIRDQINDIYDSLDESKNILTRATYFALAITIVLGFFIARSVTEPINDLTEKASKMAKGNFDQRVEVKSDDEIGNLAEMFNFLTEKLKNTLKEISSEKSKMETILHYMADGLIAVSVDGRVIHANPKAVDMLEISMEDFFRTDYNSIFEKLNSRLNLDYIINNNDKWIGSENIELEGTTLKINYAPFKDEEDKKEGLVLVIQDITEQQRLENMRREFVANVSHELKTPLTSVKSYTETLLSGMIDNREVSEKFLRVIDNEADRMTRLVRDLLQLSNFDYSQIKWDRVEHDLVRLAKQSITKLEMTAMNKNQKLELICEYEEMKGYFDYDRMEQVLINIISNSIKYTQENGKIIVSLDREGNDGIIKVKDNGIGIPEEDLPRIFERFYRVDKARSRELGGTGLGLSIAREIINIHGGTINIKSEAGNGTEVTIKLPLQEYIV